MAGAANKIAGVELGLTLLEPERTICYRASSRSRAGRGFSPSATAYGLGDGGNRNREGISWFNPAQTRRLPTRCLGLRQSPNMTRRTTWSICGLLDAKADGASMDEMARIVLGINPAQEPQRQRSGIM